MPVLLDELLDVYLLQRIELIWLLLLRPVFLLFAFLPLLPFLLLFLQWLACLQFLWLWLLVLDLLSHQVKDVFVLDTQPEESLLKLLKAKPDMILFWHDFILRQTLKDIGSGLGMHDEAKFEGSDEVTPSIEDELVIVAFIGDGEEGVLEEEVEESAEVGLESG